MNVKLNSSRKNEIEGILNSKLVEKQQLSEEDIKELINLHEVRETLFSLAGQLSPDDYEEDRMILRTYAVLLESLEYNMQRVWKFEQNRNFHSWWYQMPHCSCPHLDNVDRFGTDQRVYLTSCPVHGEV